MQFVIGYYTNRSTDSVLMLLTLILKNFFSFRSEKPNSVMAVPNSHQQHVNCKYHSICKSSPSRGQNSKQRMRGFVEGKSFKVNCSTDGPKVVPL